MQQHQGLRPETLEQLAKDGMSYEIVVHEGYPNGVAAFLLRTDLAADLRAIPTHMGLLFRQDGPAPVCAIQFDLYDPRELPESALEDSVLVRSILARQPVQIEIVGPWEPREMLRLLFDPREEAYRLLLLALGMADQFLIEFYDGTLQRRFTRRFSLGREVNTVAQRILNDVPAGPLNEDTQRAWQEAKEHFVKEVLLVPLQ